MITLIKYICNFVDVYSKLQNYCKQSSILMELGRLPLDISQIQRTIKFQFRCKYIIQDKLLEAAIHVQEDMQNISYLTLQKILDLSNVHSIPYIGC